MLCLIFWTLLHCTSWISFMANISQFTSTCKSNPHGTLPFRHKITLHLKWLCTIKNSHALLNVMFCFYSFSKMDSWKKPKSFTLCPQCALCTRCLNDKRHLVLLCALVFSWVRKLEPDNFGAFCLWRTEHKKPSDKDKSWSWLSRSHVHRAPDQTRKCRHVAPRYKHRILGWYSALTVSEAWTCYSKLIPTLKRLVYVP